MASKLVSVQQALAQNAHAQALSIAIEAWRETPDPVIADVIDALNDKTLRQVAAPGAHRKDQFQAGWLALAQNPTAATVGWLAHALSTLVPVADLPAPASYAAFHQRVATLAGLGPDPRIARAAADFIAAAPYSASHQLMAEQIYGPVIALIDANLDRRLLPRLRELEATPTAGRVATRQYLAKVFRTLLVRLELSGASLPAEVREGWKALREPAAPAADLPALGADLLSAVYANPDDVDARAVYADWLADQGDPRGELVSLQLNALRQTPSDAERSRARKLLKTHQREWLGVLAQTLRGVEFRGGFLDRAEVGPAGIAAPAIWAKAAESPQLATLRTLTVGQGTAAHYGRFLFSRHTKGLRRAEVPSLELLEHLLDGPPRAFEHLGVGRVLLARQQRSDDWKRAFPALRTLDIDIPGFGAGQQWALQRLKEHPLLAGLGRLRVFSAERANDEVVALRDAVAQLLAPTSLARLEMHRHGASAAFWRDGGKLAATIVDPTGHFWDHFLDQLPEVASLEVVLPLSLPANAPEPDVRLRTLREAGVAIEVRRVPRVEAEALLD